MNSATVLLLPAADPPPGWMLAWVARHGDLLVRQHDWRRPLRGDWMCQLEIAALERSGPLLLAAHGLGCQLVAAWGGTSAQATRVGAALLVEPAAVAAEDGRLRSWARPLPAPIFPLLSRAPGAGDWPEGRAALLAHAATASATVTCS